MAASLKQVVKDCTCQLFGAYGVGLLARVEAPSTPEPAHVATREATLVGAVVELRPAAAAASGRGKLILVTTFAVVAASLPKQHGTGPSASSALDWIGVRDWVRELTNQLAGRVANVLAASGGQLAFGSPVAVTGEAAQRELGCIAGFHVRLRSSEHQAVDVILVVPPEAQSRATTPPVSGVPREGSVTVFDGDDDA